MSDIQPAPKFPLPKPEHVQRPAPPPLDSVEGEVAPRARDTSLFGRSVRKGRPFSIGALLFGLLVIGAVVLFLGTRQLAILPVAIFPAGIALALFLSRRPTFELRITPDWIEQVGQDKRWRYEDLQGVFRPRTPRLSPGYVFHAGGFLTIPEDTDPPVDALVYFLETQPMRADENPSAAADLAEYVKTQETLYGRDQVWVFRPRLEFGPTRDGIVGRAVGIAITLTAVLWMFCGAVVDAGWLAAGMIALVVGVFLTVLFSVIRLRSAPRVKNWERSCLVVSPGGCALTQGDLRGELKWNQLKNITYNKRADFFTGQKGLLLHIDGATVQIANIYHRPLSYIQELITDLWDDFHRA